MASKTVFNVQTPIRHLGTRHVAKSRIPKDPSGAPKRTVFASTVLHVSPKSLTLYWDEATDPIAKTVTLALKGVGIAVELSTETFIDAAIDRSTPCYRENVRHEAKHVAHFRKDARTLAEKIRKGLEKVKVPSPAKPETLPQKKAKQRRQDVHKALDTAYIAIVTAETEAMALATAKKLHTSSENAKMEALCASYMP